MAIHEDVPKIRVANEQRRDKIFGKSIAASRRYSSFSTRLSFSPARFESHRIARKDRGSIEDGRKKTSKLQNAETRRHPPPFSSAF
jgi:hypothetical protein